MVVAIYGEFGVLLSLDEDEKSLERKNCTWLLCWDSYYLLL